MNVLLVDDEAFAREELASLIQQHCPALHIIGEAGSAAAARKILLAQQIDLIFLDIEMPGEDGFELLNSLPPYDFLVVFVTAFGQYAMDAINASVCSYLLKPVDPVELIHSVDRMRCLYAQKAADQQQTPHKGLPGDRLVISHVRGFQLVQIAQILFLEAQNSYTVFHMADAKQIVATKGIAAYERLLEHASFFRTHKSYLINLEHLEGFVKNDAGYVLLSNGCRLEVSRRKREQLTARVQAYANRF